MCVRAYVYFKRDTQLFRATETAAASQRMAEKEGRYLAGQAKETKQSQMRSLEEEKRRGKEKRERKRGMKNEALKQTVLRQQRTLPTRPSLGDTLGILGNAVRHATAHWPPDWLL